MCLDGSPACAFVDFGSRTCALHGRILSLKQDPHFIHYRTTWPEVPIAKSQPIDDTEELLKKYFTLNLNLSALYEQWSAADANFKKKAPSFTGVRILSQDAWEALICFICSSNNNIARISQMVRLKLTTICVHHR